MSTFFRALEQAERDRALRAQDGPASSALKDDPGDETPPSLPEKIEAPATGVDGRLVSLLSPTSFEAEQYRALRHFVEQGHRTSGLTLVGVSSPTMGDGKTVTAINLAGSLAQAPGTRVLLIDVDLRRPSVARHLALEAASGRGLVKAILHRGTSLANTILACPAFNLAVLPAGRHSNATYELLKSARLGELLEEARQQYDYVILDMPPLVPITDCRIVEKVVDGILVVVAAHRTPRRLVAEALAATDPSKLLGLIFNADDRPVVPYASTYGGSRWR